MTDIPKPPDPWVTYLPTLPSFWEVVVLVILVGGLVAAGSLLKRRWTANNESVPFPVALMLWAGMFALYLAAAAMFYKTTPDKHQTTILAWSFVFWTIPVAYYTHTVINSLAMRTVDRIGPFSAQIDDPSEFAAARKLALRGDIDGAVSMYRSYTENRVNALFEAARLLRSEERDVEAALLFEEITERFHSNRDVWAEATYQLAKLQENQLNEPKAAMVSLRLVLTGAPESRFAQLASMDLARLQVLDKDFLEELVQDEAPLPAEPADRAKRAPAPQERKVEDTSERRKAAVSPKAVPAVQGKPVWADDTPVPTQDPFFFRRYGGETESPELAAVGNMTEGATGKVRAPAKAKAAAKRKVVAKGKPRAKKEPAAAQETSAPKGSVSKPGTTPKKKSAARKPAATKKKASTRKSTPRK